MATESPAAHMKDLLLTKGFLFGGQADWAVYIGKQPDKTPARAVTIYDSGGLAPNPRWLLDYPSVQVRIRGSVNDYDIAYKKARQVRDLLLGVPSYTANNGDRIVHVNGIGDIAFTGFDDAVRPEFVFNLRLITEPAADANSNRDPL